MKKPVLSGKYSRSAPKEAPNGLEIVRTAWNQFEIVLAGGTGFEPVTPAVLRERLQQCRYNSTATALQV